MLRIALVAVINISENNWQFDPEQMHNSFVRAGKDLRGSCKQAVLLCAYSGLFCHSVALSIYTALVMSLYLQLLAHHMHNQVCTYVD